MYPTKPRLQGQCLLIKSIFGLRGISFLFWPRTGLHPPQSVLTPPPPFLVKTNALFPYHFSAQFLLQLQVVFWSPPLSEVGKHEIIIKTHWRADFSGEEIDSPGDCPSLRRCEGSEFYWPTCPSPVVPLWIPWVEMRRWWVGRETANCPVQTEDWGFQLSMTNLIILLPLTTNYYPCLSFAVRREQADLRAGSSWKCDQQPAPLQQYWR